MALIHLQMIILSSIWREGWGLHQIACEALTLSCIDLPRLHDFDIVENLILARLLLLIKMTRSSLSTI